MEVAKDEIDERESDEAAEERASREDDRVTEVERGAAVEVELEEAAIEAVAWGIREVPD